MEVFAPTVAKHLFWALLRAGLTGVALLDASG